MQVTGTIQSRPVEINDDGDDLVYSYLDVEDQIVYRLKNGYKHLYNEHVTGHVTPSNEDEDGFYPDRDTTNEMIERYAAEWIEERIARVRIEN